LKLRLQTRKDALDTLLKQTNALGSEDAYPGGFFDHRGGGKFFPSIWGGQTSIFWGEGYTLTGALCGIFNSSMLEMDMRGKKDSSPNAISRGGEISLQPRKNGASRKQGDYLKQWRRSPAVLERDTKVKRLMI